MTLLRKHRNVTISFLKEMTGASVPTIRRDLAFLASRGLIHRTWGGATALGTLDEGPHWLYTRFKDPDLKHRIAERTAQMIRPGQALSLENGTTTFMVARALLGVPRTRIVTNSLEIAYLMNTYGKCSEVVLTGGVLRDDSYLYGPITCMMPAMFPVEVAIVGAYALSAEKGITDRDENAANVKRALMQNARRTILVADHTKIGKSEPVRVDAASVIATLVTTEGAPADEIAALEEQGVEVIVC